MKRLPGFRDFYPDPLPSKDASRMAARSHIFDSWRRVALRYGFQEYDGPPLETLELYTKKSGEEIVEQLYNFVDKGDRDVALRAEMTPTLARMVVDSARNYKKPLKWFSFPQLFRYEKAQVKKGRLREHFQFNADIIGEDSVAADAEILALLIDTLRALGLTEKDFQVRVSSRDAWSGFYRNSEGVDPEREYDFFQVIDKLERTAPEETASKLKDLGVDPERVEAFIQSAEPTEDLVAVLQNLQARGLQNYVTIDYRIVRGLAYYSGVVYEAFDTEGAFRAIAGGGRYDGLIERISDGKVKLPALGFGMGDVVLSELLLSKGLLPAPTSSCDLYILIEEPSHRPRSLKLLQQAREAGIPTEYSFLDIRGDKQVKKALELGATWTARLDPESDAIVIRHLETREEQRLASDSWTSFFALSLKA